MALNLYLPNKTMTVRERGEDPYALIVQVREELLRQIKRFKRELRKDHLYRRRRQG